MHLWFADSYYGPLVRICAGTEAAGFALLCTRYVRLRPQRLPWAELLFGVHYVQFGLAVMTEPSPIGLSETIPRASSFEVAAILSLSSGVAMLAGFWIARRTSRRFRADRLFPNLGGHILDRSSHVHFVLASGFVLLTSFGSIPDTLLPIKNVATVLLSQSPLLVVATVAFLTQPRPVNRLQLLGALATLVVGLAASSMLNDTLVPIVMLGVLWWSARGRLPLLPAAAVVSTMLILQPVKRYFREFHWVDHPESGILESWQYAFSEASADSNSAEPIGQGREQATLTRLSELTSVAYVLEMVPRSVPYTGGIVYSKVLAAMVPRFLWPDKPDMTKYALDPFVIALDMTDPDTARTTTIGLSLTAQGYLEHGIPGSIGWMALFGLALGFISRYFGTSMAGVIAGASIMGPIAVNMEGGFFNIFGGLWQELAGVTALTWCLWLLGGGYRRRLTETMLRDAQPSRSGEF